MGENEKTEKILNVYPTKKDRKKQSEENKEETELQKIQSNELLQQKFAYSKWEKMKNLLNKSLPSDIKVHAITRTTKNFEPRYQAWSRVYHYICPSYLFDADIKTDCIQNLEQKFVESVIEKVKFRRLKNGDVDIKDDELVNIAKDLFHKQAKIKKKYKKIFDLDIRCLI